MATSEQKQELVDDIKRPIRYYRVTLWGYGAEYNIGESSKEEYDYWVTNAKERIAEFNLEDEDDNPFQTYMFEKDDDTKWNLVPDGLAREYDYYEYNEIDAVHGPVEGGAHISIEEILNPDQFYTEKSIDTIIDNMTIEDFVDELKLEYIVGDLPEVKQKYAYTAISSEKGTFFVGVIETQGRIDLSKIRIIGTEMIDGDTVIHEIQYNGQWVDNQGANTNGKGIYINLIKT